jgi:hypothetical protein
MEAQLTNNPTETTVNKFFHNRLTILTSFSFFNNCFSRCLQQEGLNFGPLVTSTPQEPRQLNRKIPSLKGALPKLMTKFNKLSEIIMLILKKYIGLWSNMKKKQEDKKWLEFSRSGLCAFKLTRHSVIKVTFLWFSPSTNLISSARRPP